MAHDKKPLQIRRVLLTVSDKTGVVELARALSDAGAELVATGKTARVLEDAGLKITPIESVSGSPEAFQGRMKTLSFPVCSGILYRREDASDEADLKKLSIKPIDCVVVNFYPFEQAAEKLEIAGEGLGNSQPTSLPKSVPKSLIDEIDIGGPTLVRAAAKNAPDVLVLTDPRQYSDVIAELNSGAKVSSKLALQCAARAWERVLEYDQAIADRMGERQLRKLRYGENPHQSGALRISLDSPIAWDTPLTEHELSYNNILDVSAAYGLASDLVSLSANATGVVIIKHNNPCGVALVPGTDEAAQKRALELAWQGDPVSSFGGVVLFTHPLQTASATWLMDRFVELVAAPGLARSNPELKQLVAKRKNLKALMIREWGKGSKKLHTSVPGAELIQDADTGLDEPLRSVTKKAWPEDKNQLARFGVAVGRALKSNAITLVRDKAGAFQLVGAGQGQPNRIDALKILAIPRALSVLKADSASLSDCVMVSDAFFPFRDTVDAAAQAGIRFIVQPGGSIKDQESVQACDEHGVAMVFTGKRHFKH